MAASKKNAKKADKTKGRQVLAKNRRARFDYAISETFEAGLVLTGTEVKSLRAGGASINESYAGEKDGELYLFNAHIPEYKQAASHLQHEVRRPRKLLVKKRELGKLIGAVQRKGETLVPVQLYFNSRGIAKIELGLGTGKKLHDKRETKKDRDWQRDKARIMNRKNA